MTDLLLKNVRTPQGVAVDVLVRDGRIQNIGPGLGAEAGVPVEDGLGALLLPGLVEGHTHLDKTTWDSPWYVNEVGPALTDRIENERAWRARSGHDAASHSRALALAFLREGTTRIRTHVDIDTDAGLRHLEGVHATRQELAGRVEIQTVAFPQSGLLIRPGTAELLDQALAQGADVLGGLDPSAIDRDPARSLDVLFGIASKHGKPVDIHLHEPGAQGVEQIARIAARTRALGLAGRVAISHAYALGDVGQREVADVARKLADAGVAIMTNAPGDRAFPPVLALRAAGVSVFTGNDNIQDSWWPYGNGDLLQRAMLLGYRSGFYTDADLMLALDMVTTDAAEVIGLPQYGIAEGRPATFVAVRADHGPAAVAAVPVERRVVVDGRWL